MANELTPMTFEGLVQVEQLPIITEQLRQIKDAVELKCAELSALDVSEDTVKDVKKERAELNKVFTAFETGRKGVKNALLKPYEDFEKVYAECVSEPMRQAQITLGGKITAVETELKSRKAEAVKAYYDEYAASLNIDIPFEKMGLTVTLSETEKKLKEYCKTFLDRIADDMTAITSMGSSDEIMAEYRNCLSLGTAIGIVTARRKAIEEEKKRAEARAAAEAVAKASESKIDEKLSAPSVAPAEAPKPIETPAEIYTATFKVTGTMEQLVELKKYLNERGIKYEC